MSFITSIGATRSLLSGAALAALLAGCAVGPDYQAPDTKLAAFHNTLESRAGAAPSLDRWWTGFNDAQLVTIIQRVLAQNLDLAASTARVEQARAIASGARAQLLPTADLGALATYAHQSLRSATGNITNGSPQFQRNFHEYAVGPSASWEIDLFGGVRRGAAVARGEAEAVVADHANTRVTVAADAADAYLQVRGYQMRLATAGKQIETAQRLLKLVKDRYAAGAAEGREIAQADALLKQARATIPPLRIGLEKQLNRLDVLMGAQPGTYADELKILADIPAIPPIPADSQPADMLRRRPDVIAAERRLAASSERIGAAISNYYPKISLSGALGVDSVSGHLFNASALQLLGGGALRWRLFDFGKVDAEVAQAKGANAEALAVYRQSVLRAAEDVEDALVVLTQSAIHVEQIQEQVDALLKARQLSEQAYKAGSIALTDVLDADRLLLGARDELDANRVNAVRAAVSVFRALGGGWDVNGAAADAGANASATRLAGLVK